MNIVYGGAFNPPTLAHIEIVNVLLDKFPNSKLILLPVGNDYNKPELIDFQDRYNMLNLCFNNNERVIISTLEYEINFQGTINSLDILSETYSNLYLVTGSDNIVEFKSWIRYEELLNKYPLIIINRNEINIFNEMEKFKYLNVQYENINFDSKINSTMIRKDFKTYKKWLNEDVYFYILKNKLYGVDENV